MNYAEMIPLLSKTRKVIALEMQGHGHTPYSERKINREYLAEDVTKVMDHLKIEKADLMGYSFGGQIAYQFAIKYPNRLNQLIIISSVHKSTGWLPTVNDALKMMKAEFLLNSPLKEAYEKHAPDKTKWSKFLDQMIAVAQEQFDMGDENIAKITAPVLIIAGDNDGMDKVDLAKTYQLLKGGVSADMQEMPTSQLAILPKQSHVSIINETESLVPIILKFLQ